MAIINKTGITNGGTIQAEHVTRAIDALSGGSTDSIVATGSFTGSFVGTLTGTATSASFATTASFSVNSSQAVSSSFATTASYALNAAAASSFPFSGSARITGSLGVTGSFSQSIPGEGVVIDSALSGSVSKLTLGHDEVTVTQADVTFTGKSSLDLSAINSGVGLRIPVTQPGAGAQSGSMYYDSNSGNLYIFDGNQWAYVTLTT